ncbi:unnamed protein product [Penicillium glandicola]
MTGNPAKIGHHSRLLRANKRKMGSFWEEPDDFRKVFQMMAEEMRQAREKAWIPESQLQSQYQPRPQPQPEPRELFIADGLRMLESVRTQAQSQPQPQPQRPDTTRELDLLDRARAELLNGQKKAKAILRQGSSEECKDALKALDNNLSMLLGDFEEAETSLVA